MKKIKTLLALLIVIIACVFSGNASAASVTKTDPKIFGFGDIVTIHGSGFGSRSTSSRVCWGDYCISDENIKTWTDSKIIFEFTTVGMDVSGNISVGFKEKYEQCYGSSCFTDYRWASVEGALIKVKPRIKDIMVNYENTQFLSPGDEVVVSGNYFGSSENTIMIGSERIKTFDYWGDEEIKFIVPEIDYEVLSMKVYNSAGTSVDYDIWILINYGKNEYSKFQDYLKMINFDKIYDKINILSSNDIVVAVIDSGVYWNHSDLKNNIYKKNGRIVGYNFVNDSNDLNGLMPYDQHGTQVAGIIAAENNSIGMVGIAPNTKIMPLVVLNEYGATVEDINDAIYFAVDNEADVINISLGTAIDFDGYTDEFDNAIEYAHRHDVVLVIASGNGDQLGSQGKNLNISANKNSPVCNDISLNAVVGVSAFNLNYEKTNFADYGSNCVDISSNGENIAVLSYTEGVGDDYEMVDGTSFSAPQVAGAVALFKSKYGDLKPWEIIYYLKASAKKLDKHDKELGGALDIDAFLKKKINRKISIPKPKIYGYSIENKKLHITGEYFSNSSKVALEYTNSSGVTKKKDISISRAKYSWQFSFNLPNDFKKLKKITIRNMGGNTTKSEEDLQKLNNIDYNKSTENISISSESCGNNSSVNNNDKCECKNGYKWASDDVDNLDCIKKTDNTTNEESSNNQIFSDIKSDNKNKTAIEYMKKKGIIKGYDDNSFKPSNPVNRAELLKILIEAKVSNFNSEEYDTNCFSDVKSGEWFTPYVCYAKEEEWIGGYADDTFKPANSVSKVEAVKIILTAYGFSVPSEVSSSYFTDVKSSDWFAGYLFTAHKKGLLETKSGYYSPNNNINRANVSQIIYNVIKYIEENGGNSISGEINR